MSKKYYLEFSVYGLPRTTNSLAPTHWSVKGRHAKEWRAAVVYAVRACGISKPDAPLAKAKLTLIRISSGKLDYDGLVSTFKPVIDGLVDAEVLVDDDIASIGIPEYKQEKGKQGRGKITVIVEEL